MKILLVSHGELATGLISSYQMIAGENKNLEALILTADGINDFSRRLIEKLDSFQNEKVLILCDIKGGTPFNESYKYQLMHSEYISIVCGMNLPMLIEIGTIIESAQDLDHIYDTAIKVGRDAVEGIKGSVAESITEEEKIDEF